MSLAHKLAWAAGFFDGEGFVTIQMRNTKAKKNNIVEKRYYSYYLRIGINHVAIEPLLEIQRILGGTIRKQSEESVKGKRKPRHSWQLSCNQAAEALKKLMPYFKNKHKAAEIGLELQRTMNKNKEKTSEEMMLYRAMLKEKLKNLNALD